MQSNKSPRIKPTDPELSNRYQIHTDEIATLEAKFKAKGIRDPLPPILINFPTKFSIVKDGKMSADLTHIMAFEKLMYEVDAHNNENQSITNKDIGIGLSRIMDKNAKVEPCIRYRDEELDIPVFSYGTVNAIVGPQGTFKSAVAMMFASCYAAKASKIERGDFLGHVARPHSKEIVKRASVFIDTERTRGELKLVMEAVASNLHLDDNIEIPNLGIIMTEHMTTQSRVAYTLALIQKFGGNIGLWVIDVSTDLIDDWVKGMEESRDLTSSLKQLAATYNLCIILTTHSNPGQARNDNYKAGGHWGSALLKKCNTVVIVKESELDPDVFELTTNHMDGKLRLADKRKYTVKFKADGGYNRIVSVGNDYVEPNPYDNLYAAIFETLDTGTSYTANKIAVLTAPMTSNPKQNDRPYSTKHLSDNVVMKGVRDGLLIKDKKESKYTYYFMSEDRDDLLKNLPQKCHAEVLKLYPL